MDREVLREVFLPNSQGRRHTFLAGGGGRISAVSFGSDQWKDMCFYGTDVRDLASFDLISPRQSKNCDET